MSALNQEQHATEVARIESLLAWKQPLSEKDQFFYRDHLMLKWSNAKETLEAAKADEADLRKQVVAFISDPNKKKGTERIPLNNGYEAKVGKSIRYGFVKNADGKLDKGAIDAALTAIEKSGPAGAYIAENLVKWEPTLSLTEYNKLDEPIKKIIDAVIVTTDGMPTLEIIEPKGSKK